MPNTPGLPNPENPVVEQGGHTRRRVLAVAGALGVGGVAAVVADKLGWIDNIMDRFSDTGSEAENTGEGNGEAVAGPLTVPPEFDTSREVDLVRGGQWGYMPGAKPYGKGVRMTATGLATRTEDGDYFPNPPINLYGTHLENGGNDFGLAAKISDVQPGETATLHFHGDPTYQYDERIYMHAGVAVTVDGDRLKVQVWRGDGQEASYEKQMPTARSGDKSETVDFWMRQKDGKLVIGSGSHQLELDEAVFTESGQVWFGADANAGGGFNLDELRAYPLKGGKDIEAKDTSKADYGKLDPKGLQGLSNKTPRKLPIGTAVDLTPLMYDEEFARLVVANFDVLETEILAKPQATQPRPGQFEFGPLDALVDFANRHGKQVFGHTLVFGEANPKWMEDEVERSTPRQALDLMRAHIQGVVGRYAGKIKSWDVVNEPFDAGDWAALRPHMWMRKIGKTYIAEAFRAAHKADPDALLFMNEWALEMDDDRWNANIELLEELLAADVPIHGIGFQCHVFEEDIANGDQLNFARMKARFAQLKKMGLKVRISELSVPDEDPELQAQQYAGALKVCMEADNCVGFNIWGPASSPYYFTSEPNRLYEFDAADGSIGNDAPWKQYEPGTKPVPKLAVERMKRVLLDLAA